MSVTGQHEINITLGSRWEGVRPMSHQDYEDTVLGRRQSRVQAVVVEGTLIAMYRSRVIESTEAEGHIAYLNPYSLVHQQSYFSLGVNTQNLVYTSEILVVTQRRETAQSGFGLCD
jgi:hypothetical protein